MKGQIIGTYILIACLYGTGSWLFGEFSYRGFAYNLGVGFAWPFSIFKSYPEFDDSNPVAYGRSYVEVVRSHPNDREGYILFNEAIGLLAFYFYAEENKNVKLNDYRKMFEQGKISSNFFNQMLENPVLAEKIRNYTDGMSFGDVVSDLDDIRDDIVDLLEDRE